MITLLSILITIVCVILMTAILMQNPKGGGVNSSFGGSETRQLFGAANSIVLIEKITWTLASTLFLLCIITAIVANA